MTTTFRLQSREKFAETEGLVTAHSLRLQLETEVSERAHRRLAGEKFSRWDIWHQDCAQDVIPPLEKPKYCRLAELTRYT